MTLKDTVEMMNSDDYKERFKAEYYQLVTRYRSLKSFNSSIALSISFSSKLLIVILLSGLKSYSFSLFFYHITNIIYIRYYEKYSFVYKDIKKTFI